MVISGNAHCILFYDSIIKADASLKLIVAKVKRRLRNRRILNKKIEFFNTRISAKSVLDVFANVNLLQFINTRFESNSSLNIYGGVQNIKFNNTISESYSSLSVSEFVPYM
ncbi:hypothetical protein GJ496_000155 [Pomphorhynchus laevis]|nr:hypothetical protein GJ496_000155 [Pomphorhynchus laevis]